MNFRTLSDLNDLILNHLESIPEDVDLVVGIPRSGLLVANMIALYKNLPLTDMASFLEGRLIPCGNTRKRTNWITDIHQARRILLVDDSFDSGRSMQEAREKIRNMECSSKVLTCAAYVTPSNSNYYPDLYFEVCKGPRMFEWNYLHSVHLTRACCDLDGVLCRDPLPEENDDGENYRAFLQNVPARVAPTFEIAHIITARLEKYRPETEAWLKKNHIAYGDLIMSPYATMQERVNAKSHGRFKADYYSSLKDTYIFIESSQWQAAEISEITGKAVFCLENHTFYPEGYQVRLHSEMRTSANTLRIEIAHVAKRMLPEQVVRFLKKLLHWK